MLVFHDFNYSFAGGSGFGSEASAFLEGVEFITFHVDFVFPIIYVIYTFVYKNLQLPTFVTNCKKLGIY